MTTTLDGTRKPVAIDDGIIRAGTQSAAFDSEMPETLFRNYLRLVRRARSQQRSPEISLRREDVEAIAEYLDITTEQVLNRLATLMGSTRTQRTSVLAAFASGALLIGLAGSASATPTTASSERPESPAPEAVDQVRPMEQVAAVEQPAPTQQTDAVPTSAESIDDARPSRARSTIVVDPVGADRPPFVVVRPLAPVVAPPTTTNSGSTSGNRAADEVALVQPVVPNPANSVAVGTALVPPVSSVPAADVSTSPTTPPPATSTTVPEDEVPQELPPVDEDTVAVGPPPVPPTTSTTTTPTTTTTTPTTTTAPPAVTGP